MGFDTSLPLVSANHASNKRPLGDHAIYFQCHPTASSNTNLLFKGIIEHLIFYVNRISTGKILFNLLVLSID